VWLAQIARNHYQRPPKGTDPRWPMAAGTVHPPRLAAELAEFLVGNCRGLLQAMGLPDCGCCEPPALTHHPRGLTPGYRGRPA